MKTKTIFSLIVALMLTACSQDSGGGSSGGPGANPQKPETSPITAPTATPTPTPNPGEEPTPTPVPGTTPTPVPGTTPTPVPGTTPTPVPGTTPTPTPPPQSGDWNTATNLAQSIYDIRLDYVFFTTYKITVKYYDIDHLTQNPADFSRSATFWADFMPPGEDHFSVDFSTNRRAFNGSSLECNANCTEGVLKLHYAGANGSRLNGDALVPFFKKTVEVASAYRNSGSASCSLEQHIYDTFHNGNYLVGGGALYAFQVQGGLVQPYGVELLYSEDGGLQIEQRIKFTGKKLGQSVPVSARFEDALHVENESLGNAKVTSNGTSTLGICFQDTNILKSIGFASSGVIADPCL